LSRVKCTPTKINKNISLTDRQTLYFILETLKTPDVDEQEKTVI